MRNSRVVRALAAGALSIGLAGGLSGCLYAGIPEVAPSQASVGEGDLYSEDLVLVAFAFDAEFSDENVLENMWPVEQEALIAIKEAGLGYLDGSEIGASGYFLYFYGDDRDAMWELLEPILREAPMEIARVELWPPGADAEPEILTFRTS